MTAAAPPFPAVPFRFARIVAMLCVAVARHAGRYPITKEMTDYVVAKLRVIDRRFQRLVAMIQAGIVPPERDYRPRGPRAAPRPSEPEAPDTPVAAKPIPVWKLLCMDVPGWLCRITRNDLGLPFAATYSWALARLLEEAETRALLDASPRLVRLLKPLCRALAVDPNLLPTLPPRPRPAARAAPPVVRAESPAGGVNGRAGGVNGAVDAPTPNDPPMRPILPSVGPSGRGKRREKMFAPGVPLRYPGVTAFG